MRKHLLTITSRSHTQSAIAGTTQIRHFSSNQKFPNVIEEIKLDFNDVLFQPKRSSLKSRSEVNMERDF